MHCAQLLNIGHLSIPYNSSIRRYWYSHCTDKEAPEAHRLRSQEVAGLGFALESGFHSTVLNASTSWLVEN